MSDDALRCHYCGERCGVYGAEPYLRVVCTAPDCVSSGPRFPTPEAARAAHARVMPVPAWTRKSPKEGEPTWQACKRAHGPILISKFNPEIRCPDCEFAPVVRPAEPAEGGGE